MPESELSHVHHYVPEWYQKRFLASGSHELWRLELNPQRIKTPNGKSYIPKACMRRPPSRCFCTNDLYMLRFKDAETDAIERKFFGSVDREGERAVGILAGLTAFTSEVSEAFRPFLRYMGAQRFRTPRGLDWLRKSSKRDRQSVLFLLTQIFQAHSTMWTEGTWEIVCADYTENKFILSDSPVTFYNSVLPPSLSPYPGSEELDRVATRTIFPLGLTRCLIITHTQYVRAPKTKPLAVRTNARSFEMALFKLTDIQIARQLNDDEVKRINFVIKKTATKYIAAGQKEWLYPESQSSSLGWADVDNDWFLMPNPWRVGFTSEVRWQNREGRSWGLDAYGRKPYDPNYKDRRQRDREWISAEQTKREWAKKRGKAPRSRTMEFRDEIHDKFIDDYLATLPKCKKHNKHPPTAAS